MAKFTTSACGTSNSANECNFAISRIRGKPRGRSPRPAFVKSSCNSVASWSLRGYMGVILLWVIVVKFIFFRYVFARGLVGMFYSSGGVGELFTIAEYELDIVYIG